MRRVEGKATEEAHHHHATPDPTGQTGTPVPSTPRPREVPLVVDSFEVVTLVGGTTMSEADGILAAAVTYAYTVGQAVIVVFTITPRADVPLEEYEATSAKMVELVSAAPGFLGMDYGESEGREILVARFESHEALGMWREQPDHVVAQQLGRERFFAHYRIEVCELVRQYEFAAEEAPSR